MNPQPDLQPETNAPGVDDLTAPLSMDPKPKSKRTWTTKFGPPEEKEAPIDPVWAKWKKSGQPSDLHAVVQRLDPVIDRAMQAYGQQGPVVKGRAQLLAARAVQNFDPSRGADLSTHVHRQLQELQRTGEQISSPMPLPERLRRQRAETARHIEELRNQLGRDVTDEEVAEKMHVPVARVAKTRGLMNARMSQSAMEEQEDENDDRPDMITKSRGPEDDWVDAVYHEMGPIDQLILRHRTGYRGNPVLQVQDLARRLNISSAAVTQRANKIQARLDQFWEPRR